MILKSDNERHSYGPDKLVPPARQPASQPASQPARIRQSNNQFFPSENLVNQKPDYDVWLCMSKMSGQIHSAGCNCNDG
ncbi:hypothetical protein DPMN_182643 [Dreissena polymorpha]|uniref:Uncharacterized protein n=1 Tax=Dreissena polymorpha TaxID=45954 RepID=A0A9D4DGW6_DREPO|nr:hypothetical protein DPMN_182643 [Dreissena polymorpha]